MEQYRIEDELTACPSCSSRNIKHLDYIRGRRVRTTNEHVLFETGCDDCGAIFVNPSPPSEKLNAYYSEEGGWNEKKGYEELEQEGGWAARIVKESEAGKSNVHTIIAHARMAFGTDLNGRSILDFGCGRGQLLDKLAPFGLETYGLDPATTTMVTRHRMLTELPAEPTFDIVSAIHVLEHVPAPLQTLKELRSVLRPNGLFVCGMPALDGLREHRKKRYVVNKDQHISVYTRRSLSSLLAIAGFQAVAFYPGMKPQRFRCAALWSDNPEPVTDPLRDAEEEIRAFRETEPAWLPEMAALSTRELAYLENVRLGLEDQEIRRKREKKKRKERMKQSSL